MGIRACAIGGSGTPAHCSRRTIVANRRGTESRFQWPSRLGQVKTSGMRQLSQKCRIRFRQNLKDSNAKMKMFVDMMSPIGHISLNRFYLLNCYKKGDVLLASSELRVEYREYDFVSIGDKACGSSLIKRLYTAWRVLALIIRSRPTELILLSYDLLSFPLITNVSRLLKIGVTCFEHNTAPTTKARIFSHKLAGNFALRLVYTPYLSRMYRQLGLSCEYIPHPCVKPPDDISDHSNNSRLNRRASSFEFVVFCPSGSVDLRQIEEISVFYPTHYFICKSRRLSTHFNIYTQCTYLNYQSIMSMSDAVYIPFKRNCKISGPFFEAMAMGKPAVVLDNEFGMYLKSLFPSNVHFSFEEISYIESPKHTLNNLAIYNSQIVEKLKSKFD
ncbi:MAG: hypothetical protein GY807_16050 [Gammaproteobacteria bacterium]|nr:hypothetical protein [Gammaproteobacteria bacterium]